MYQVPHEVDDDADKSGDNCHLKYQRRGAVGFEGFLVVREEHRVRILV